MTIIKIIDQSIPYVSGYSMRSNYIINALHDAGIDMKVFTSPIFQYENAKERIEGVEYIRCNGVYWRIFKKIPVLREIANVKTIIDYINNNWVDGITAVHAHSSVLNGVAAYFVAKKYKIPFIYEIRALWEDAAVDLGKTIEGSIRYRLTRHIETMIAKKANKIVVICEGLKNELVKRGISEKKITVVPNGVDCKKFIPAAKNNIISEKYNLNGKKVVGFIGTFFKFEGLEILIKSAKEVLSKRKDVAFLIVGSGVEEPSIKKMIAEMNLGKNVILTGRVKHEDICKYYSVMNILVYPRISKRITEIVTPLKPLEAMAFQKVVIGSDVGGIKELVTNGKNGLLFKSGDPEDLTRTIFSIIDDGEKIKELGENARNYTLKERGWDILCKKYIFVYKELGVA